MHNNTYACIICRVALKGSGQCPGGHASMYMGTRWRAPKKNNIKAWKKLANGQPLWDDKSVQRKLVRQAMHHARSQQLQKLRRRKRLTRSELQTRLQEHNMAFKKNDRVRHKKDDSKGIGTIVDIADKLATVDWADQTTTISFVSDLKKTK